MDEPTGKLKFAYDTIRGMTEKILGLENEKTRIIRKLKKCESMLDNVRYWDGTPLDYINMIEKIFPDLEKLEQDY